MCLKKFLLIIFMFFICIFLLNISVVNASFDFEHNSEKVILNDFQLNCPYVVVYESWYKKYSLFCLSDFNEYKNEGFKIVKNGNYFYYYKENDNTQIKPLTPQYQYNNEQWELFYDSATFDFNYYPNHANSEILYCNFDIYNIDGSLFLESNFQIPFPTISNIEDLSTNKDFQKIFINANNINSDFKITIQQDYYPFPELEEINSNYGPAVTFEISQSSINYEYLGETKLFYISRQAIENTFKFINNQTYSFWFSYSISGDELISSVTKIETKWKTSEQVTEDNISDINNFFKDDTFNKDTITNNMPNSDSYNDPTSNSFDNFFNTLKNSFTSQNYKDIVLPIPFTKGKEIVIPTNLTENIVPDLLKNLIRMVYWFILSRFIVKDIASYIEKAKSGDIFSHTDTNIKTDML